MSPSLVAARAAARGVTHWSLTDHDSIAGLAEAREAARSHRLKFFPGVELSVTWNFQTVHVVGLGIDPDSEALVHGLRAASDSRQRRAERIAQGLAKIGVDGSLAGAYSYVEAGGLIGRTHFARHLVASGYGVDLQDVFKRYLVPGTPGYVQHAWPALDRVVDWIRSGGGVAVLAHPGRYRLSPSQRVHLIQEFRQAGGLAIEVITASHAPSQYHEFAALCEAYGLRASRGSDFHGPGVSRSELGDLPALPSRLRPVWTLLT